MKYLLDTNTCIFYLRGNATITEKVRVIGNANLAISFMTVSELFYGAYKSEQVAKNLAKLHKLLTEVRIVNSNNAISDNFGKLKAALEKTGRRIDDADLLIAAVAQTQKLILVTDNYKHFTRLDSLQLENWL